MISIFFEYSRRYSTFPVLRWCRWHWRSKWFYYSWMILSYLEWTLLRSNIYWWLAFLLILPLKALANCKRSYWCITGVNDTGNACIAGVIDTGKDMLPRCCWHRRSWRSLLPGISDTGDAWRHRCRWYRTYFIPNFLYRIFLYRTFYTELILYRTYFIPNSFYTELILYRTGRGRGDWGGALEGLAVIVSWGGHCELGGRERTVVACWRGWRSLWVGRGREDWDGLLEGLVVIVSWEGERGLGWPAGGVCGQKNYSPVSLTPANTCFAGVKDKGE